MVIEESSDLSLEFVKSDAVRSIEYRSGCGGEQRFAVLESVEDRGEDGW